LNRCSLEKSADYLSATPYHKKIFCKFKNQNNGFPYLVQHFALVNLGLIQSVIKSSKVIIFVPLLTTFNLSKTFFLGGLVII